MSQPFFFVYFHFFLSLLLLFLLFCYCFYLFHCYHVILISLYYHHFCHLFHFSFISPFSFIWFIFLIIFYYFFFLSFCVIWLFLIYFFYSILTYFLVPQLVQKKLLLSWCICNFTLLSIDLSLVLNSEAQRQRTWIKLLFLYSFKYWSILSFEFRVTKTKELNWFFVPFGAILTYFGVRVGLENNLRFLLCSLKAFIFYACL